MFMLENEIRQPDLAGVALGRSHKNEEIRRYSVR